MAAGVLSLLIAAGGTAMIHGKILGLIKGAGVGAASVGGAGIGAGFGAGLGAVAGKLLPGVSVKRGAAIGGGLGGLLGGAGAGLLTARGLFGGGGGATPGKVEQVLGAGGQLPGNRQGGRVTKEQVRAEFGRRLSNAEFAQVYGYYPQTQKRNGGRKKGNRGNSQRGDLVQENRLLRTMLGVFGKGPA